jgi:hypothetical protein
MAPPSENGDRTWGEYRRLILNELERINKSIDDVNTKIERFRQDDLSQIKTDIALLKFQAALWGALASAVVSGVIAFVFKLLK